MLLSKININKKNKKIVHWYGFENFYKFFPEILVKKIKKFFSIKLFSIQKGFDKVIKKNGDDAYFKILEEIENIDFDINELKFSKLIFGKNIKKKELILKQFLIKYFYHPVRSDLSISRSLLKAIENNYKLTFPLHKNYFRIFEKKKYKNK